MENKKISKILVIANNPLDYPDYDKPIKNGYKIIYDDFTSKFIELPYTVSNYGYVEFTGFKDKEIIFKYKNSANQNIQLMYFKDKVVELQEKYCCPECNGWLEPIFKADEDEHWIEYTCTKCKEVFDMSK